MPKLCFRLYCPITSQLLPFFFAVFFIFFLQNFCIIVHTVYIMQDTENAAAGCEDLPLASSIDYADVFVLCYVGGFSLHMNAYAVVYF